MARLSARSRVALFALLTTALTAPSAYAFDRMVVFGDSLSDNGNLALATGNAQPGYPSGRFSNGPVWAEQLAGPLANFFPVGPVNNAANVDFAFGGARTDTAVANPPGIPTQIVAYFARGGTFGANNLVSVWGGANDIFQAIPGAVANPATALATMQGVSATAAGNIATSVNTVAGAGATQIVVMNLPDIGAAPAFNTSPVSQLASASALTFNSALASSLATVAAGRPTVNIMQVDVAALFGAVTANPGAFGFSNATQACVAVASCVGGTTAQQNSFVFWDGVHPTTAGHALVAQAVAATLAAPATAAYSASLADVSLMGRRAEAMRGFERLRAHEAQVGVNEYFVNVFGDFGKSRSAGAGYRSDWSVGGLQFGMTRGLSTALTFGLAGSASTGRVKAGAASYDATTFAVDAMLGWRQGGAFVNAGLGAGVNRMTDWERKTFVGPLKNTGDPSGHAMSAILEGGYDIGMGTFTLTPAARLGWLHAKSDAFTEIGAVAPIAFGGRTLNAIVGAAELRARFDIVREPGRVASAYALVGYEDFLSYSGGAVRGRLAGNTALPFVTPIGDLAGEGVQLGAGLSGSVGAMKLNAEYRASLGKGDGARHRGSVGVKMAF